MVVRKMPNMVKTYKDYHLVKDKLKLYQTNISKVKNYEDFNDLTEMYLEGESKLQKEYEAAKRVPA